MDHVALMRGALTALVRGYTFRAHHESRRAELS